MNHVHALSYLKVGFKFMTLPINNSIYCYTCKQEILQEEKFNTFVRKNKVHVCSMTCLSAYKKVLFETRSRLKVKTLLITTNSPMTDKDKFWCNLPPLSPPSVKI